MRTDTGTIQTGRPETTPGKCLFNGVKETRRPTDGFHHLPMVRPLAGSISLGGIGDGVMADICRTF
jgi:hypothetical protein